MATPPTAPGYASIEEVPGEELQRILLELLHSFGATAPDDLIKATARHLGFKRTGPNIKACLENTLENLIRRGEVVRTSDDRLQAVPKDRAVRA